MRKVIQKESIKLNTNKSNKLLLLIGASASGKTTWAEQFTVEQEERFESMDLTFTQNSWVNINRDDVRFELFTEGKRDWTKYKFCNKNEREVTEECLGRANLAVSQGSSIIISDTNLNPAIRNNWKDFAKEYGYEYEEKLFPCDWNTLVKRNAQREGGIPENILFSQYKRYMQQYGFYGEHKVEMYQPNSLLPSTIIVDLDGTIANMKGVRKPYDWHLVGEDKPRQNIIDMVKALGAYHGHIMFMSGRDGESYYDTLDWIDRHVMTTDMKGIQWDLVMREYRDDRKDDIIKYELFNKHVRGKFNVEAVFDDRYSIVRLWSVLELPDIIQVGEYQNEF